MVWKNSWVTHSSEEAYADNIGAKSQEMFTPNKWLDFFLRAEAEDVWWCFTWSGEMFPIEDSVAQSL